MLAMVGDIAWKCMQLNPHLGEEASVATPGIVLIDELDLHLHPNWQRRIVDDLRNAFPNIQFIATTHSPFIVQSLREGELLELQISPSVEGGLAGGQTETSTHPQAEYSDQSIEDIAENVMGVDIPQKSERYLQMMQAAEVYFRLLRSTTSPGELAAAEERLNELSAPFSDDPAFQALLNVERELHRNRVSDASS
jgi:predicted ATP-binding protein involved in virulence